jgi:hypothetical protein
MDPALTFYRIAAYIWILLLMPLFASADSVLRMHVDDNHLTLSAHNADLKSILQRLNEETGIAVRYPNALDKKVTAEMSDVVLEMGLRRILKGINYATVYSKSADSDSARVSKVYVFKAYQGSQRTTRDARRRKRIEDRIGNYRKRIQAAQRRLAQAASDSQSGRRFQRQIRSYQRTVERLEQQLE